MASGLVWQRDQTCKQIQDAMDRRDGSQLAALLGSAILNRATARG